MQLASGTLRFARSTTLPVTHLQQHVRETLIKTTSLHLKNQALHEDAIDSESTEDDCFERHGNQVRLEASRDLLGYEHSRATSCSCVCFRWQWQTTLPTTQHWFYSLHPVANVVLYALNMMQSSVMSTNSYLFAGP